MTPTQAPVLNLQQETIGNFTVEQRGDTTRVHYRRSLKDWLDMAYFLILGGAAAAFVVFLARHSRFDEWVMWLVAALFSFVALLKLADAFVRLTQATRSVLVLAHREKKLVAKYPYLRRTVIDFSDIRAFLLKGRREKISISNRSTVRTYCDIVVLDSYGRERTVLSINPTQVWRFPEQKIEVSTYQTGRKLARRLADLTGAKYQWKGYRAL